MKDADLRRCGLHVEFALMVSMLLWPCIMLLPDLYYVWTLCVASMDLYYEL